jgi:ComF family protein
MKSLFRSTAVLGNPVCPGSLGSLVREWCFPSGCALCGKLLVEKEDAFYGLCGQCGKRIVPVPEGRCGYCGRRLVSETAYCMDCRRRVPGLVSRINAGGTHRAGTGFRLSPAEEAFPGPSFSFFPYAGEYRTLMGAYKYGRNRNLGNFLAAVILQNLPLFVDPLEIPECWVPVPPRPGKIKKTGWDQVTFLCRCLERFKRFGPLGQGLRDFYIYPCLKRLPSRLQKELNREDRLRNLKGRIRLTKPVPRRVLLLDDVITTGATLEAASDALKEGGALEVLGLTLFYD